MVGWLGKHWHDGLDVVSAGATAVAAALAWWAIRKGNQQAKASADALVRERRIDFELDHLTDLDEAFLKGSSVGFATETVQRCLRLLPASEFPRLRQFWGFDSTPWAEAELRATRESAPSGVNVMDATLGDGTTYRAALTGEIHRAIERRLGERR